MIMTPSSSNGIVCSAWLFSQRRGILTVLLPVSEEKDPPHRRSQWLPPIALSIAIPALVDKHSPSPPVSSRYI